jgi:hypothetical protein
MPTRSGDALLFQRQCGERCPRRRDLPRGVEAPVSAATPSAGVFSTAKRTDQIAPAGIAPQQAHQGLLQHLKGIMTGSPPI